IHIHSAGKNIYGLALECFDFAVNQDVYGHRQIEFHAAHGASRGEWMLRVRSVVKTGQSAQKAKTADWSPSNKFDVAVSRVSVRCDKHGAASIFAVAEGKKQSAAVIPFHVFIASQREGTAPKLDNAHKNTEQITERPERLEIAI